MKINKNIFKVEFTRGTGAGGQHKNKVETCAVVIHIESGEKEKCEDTRYKNKNLEIEWKNTLDVSSNQLDYDFEYENKLKTVERLLSAVTEKCKRIFEFFYFQKNNSQMSPKESLFYRRIPFWLDHGNRKSVTGKNEQIPKNIEYEKSSSVFHPYCTFSFLFQLQ